jgi:hypothetical protein
MSENLLNFASFVKKAYMNKNFLSTLLRPEWRWKASPGRAGWLIVLCLSGCAPKEPCDKSVYKNDPKNVAALGYTTEETAVVFEYTDLKTKLVDTLEFRGRLTDTLDYMTDLGRDTAAYFCKPAWQLKKAHFICTENPRYNFRVYLYPDDIRLASPEGFNDGPWLIVYFYGEKQVFDMFAYSSEATLYNNTRPTNEGGITYNPNMGITRVTDNKTQTWRLLR